MSIDFIALFDLSSENITAEWLLANLAENLGSATEVVELYRDHWLPKEWSIEPSPVTGQPQILGSGGFSLTLKPRTLELYHMMRFATFTGDLASRTALRRACLVIADLAGSFHAIYTHELMPYEGEDLREIENGLRARIGPPATTFEELDAAEYYGPRAWYIDRFADLRGALRSA
jgi:hypothetical protein